MCLVAGKFCFGRFETVLLLDRDSSWFSDEIREEIAGCHMYCTSAIQLMPVKFLGCIINDSVTEKNLVEELKKINPWPWQN